MTENSTRCLECSKWVPKHDVFVDLTGQFPKLNVKAMERGKRAVEICFDCYETLKANDSGHKSGNFRSQGFI